MIGKGGKGYHKLQVLKYVCIQWGNYAYSSSTLPVSTSHKKGKDWWNQGQFSIGQQSKLSLCRSFGFGFYKISIAMDVQWQSFKLSCEIWVSKV